MRKILSSKTNSIYYRFLKLMVLAFFAAFFFFFLLNKGGTIILNSYFAKSDYMERENQKKFDAFKNYVSENELSTEDTDIMSEWVSEQSVVWIQLYRDHILLFDSQFPYMRANPEFHVKGKYYEWEWYRILDFKDGPAQVFITGIYTKRYFDYALIIEFFLSLLLFTGIVMAGIRSPMKYIKKLSSEIEILESGNLDYRITIIGNDEITVLAKGLDNMRKSIHDQIRQEAELIQINQSMISSLSHDLRTPLTSLLIYTEILKSEIDASRVQMQQWVCKIDEKAQQIKGMADSILEYSLQKKVFEPISKEQQSFHSAFYDALSEIFICLDQKGFHIQTALTWENREVCIDPKYITRILDNISSNITKYASYEIPVRITSFYHTDCGGFLFENPKRHDTSQVDSTGIGVPNIRTMMEEMGGSCEVEETETAYRIKLSFHYAKPSAL